MPPIASVVGKSKSGKTTLIEKLAQELKSRGTGFGRGRSWGCGRRQGWQCRRQRWQE